MQTRSVYLQSSSKSLFRFRDIAREQLLQFHRTVRNEVGGALSVFDTQQDIELVPTYGARANTSGGTLAAGDWSRIAREFLNALAISSAVDGAYFSMHGAMSAENEDDPEGYLLQEARAILGSAFRLFYHSTPTAFLRHACSGTAPLLSCITLTRTSIF